MVKGLVRVFSGLKMKKMMREGRRELGLKKREHLNFEI